MESLINVLLPVLFLGGGFFVAWFFWNLYIKYFSDMPVMNNRGIPHKKRISLTNEYGDSYVRSKSGLINPKMEPSELFARTMFFSVYEFSILIAITLPILAGLIAPLGIFGSEIRVYAVLGLIVYNIGIASLVYFLMIVLESLFSAITIWIEERFDSIVTKLYGLLLATVIGGFGFSYAVLSMTRLILGIF